VELVVAASVLGGSAGGPGAALLLLAWTALGLGALAVWLRRLRAWTVARLGMTNDLVERMIGHRTRLAQEPRDEWHDAEDEQLAAYAARSAELDRVATLLLAVVPRGWLVVGAGAIAVGFAGDVRSPGALALWLGATILGYRALAKLTAGVSSLLGAAVAWTNTAPLFAAAARKEPGDPAALGALASTGGPLVEARNVYFHQRARREPVLNGVTLQIRANDRLLLEGPSGGGKSTLGAVLSGLRVPDSGVLLLHGLDRQTFGGDTWRRHVVAAPQFHENHVVTATLAFNLLMGRGWPPRRGDMEEATAVCKELGLGALIERMPGGLMQMVGETGWQLSHGERSRLFIARALLQRAELVVLDESFAALDPETLERALRCVLARAPALLVIAHP
jgi:ATP-binding cassette subfamily B protein